VVVVTAAKVDALQVYIVAIHQLTVATFEAILGIPEVHVAFRVLVSHSVPNVVAQACFTFMAIVGDV